MRKFRSAADAIIVTTVVCIEEEFRGWLAEINRYGDVHKQLAAYGGFTELLKSLTAWEILPFDDAAATEFKRLRAQRIRIGTQDLKIASICRIHGALLLSANLRDFRKVPNLLVEDWLH